MKAISLSLLLLLTSISGYTQQPLLTSTDTLNARYNLFSALSSPEKLFLHTDKDTYSTGETVWFKGYLQNKSLLSEFPESNFIYVELLHSDTLVNRVKVKRTEDGFNGHVQLPHTLPFGSYTIRGYSRWMTGFSEKYMYHKELFIVNGVRNQDRSGVENAAGSPLVEAVFYPESGRFFANQSSYFAFKANNRQGKGVAVSGELYNSRDSLITSFTSQHAGMGFFTFFPIKGESYYAVVKDNDQTTLKVALPEPADEGAIVNLRKRDDKLYISHHVSEGLLNKKLVMMIHNGHNLYYAKPVSTSSQIAVLLENELTEGINHISIIDPATGAVYAERLFFIYPPIVHSASLFSDKNSHGKREKVNVELQLSDDKKQPVKGAFSLAVTDYFLAPKNVDDENLTSYMLLSSELMGSIEDPGYYFNTGIDRGKREAAIDLLMAVQGWRYYDISSIATAKNMLLMEKEYSQQISGKASAMFRRAKNASIFVLAPATDLALVETLDAGGRFIVDGLDFADSTTFIIAASKKSDKNNLFVTMVEDEYPSTAVGQHLPARLNVSKNFISEYEDISKLLYIASGQEEHYTLSEAQVNAPTLYHPRHNPSPYNQSFDKNSVKERKDLEPYDALRLNDYLRVMFPFLFQKQGYSINAENTPSIYIDKIEMEDITSDVYANGDLSPLVGMTVYDVETLAVLRGPAAGALYRTSTGVILIKTRHTAGTTHKNLPLVAFFSPLGWQKPAKFYSPSYELKEDKENPVSDLRTTLLWDPLIKTDENGKASISFYTADRTTRLRFIVEGIADDGNYVSTVNVLE